MRNINGGGVSTCGRGQRVCPRDVASAAGGGQKRSLYCSGPGKYAENTPQPVYARNVPDYAHAVVLNAEMHYCMRVVGIKIFVTPTCAGVEWSW